MSLVIIWLNTILLTDERRTSMDRKQLDVLIAQQDEKRHPLAQIQRDSETEFSINNHQYEVELNSQNGFQFEEFVRRYNPALSQFDFIVGDWGYGQLRLKGFYNDDREVVTGPFISALNDYLLEDINFGAAYFVVHNLEARPIVHKSRSTRSRHHSSRGRSRNNRRNSRNHAFVEQKVAPVKPPLQKRKKLIVKTEEKSHKHHFIIRESKN